MRLEAERLIRRLLQSSRGVIMRIVAEETGRRARGRTDEVELLGKGRQNN